MHELMYISVYYLCMCARMHMHVCSYVSMYAYD